MHRQQKPPGTVCMIGPFVTSAELEPVAEGQYLLTRGNSCYRVLEAHPIKGNTHRQRLKCLRTRPEDIPADAVVLGMVWDGRKRK